MKSEEVKYKEIWNSEYRNVRFEITKWRLGGNHPFSFTCWNYYIFLPIDQIPREFHTYFILEGKYSKMTPESNERLFYDYSNASYLSDLDWHGDLTFYEKTLDSEGKLIGIKLGCDYAHAFDERVGYPYDIDYVLMETKQTIDKLHKLIPNLKISCQWDGKYYDKSECEELPQGGYIAKINCDKGMNMTNPQV